MGHIAGRGGRFVTVMPRSRKEDGAFRGWLQSHTPVWTEATRGPSSRLGEPDEVYSTTPALTPSTEGYRIVWVHSTAKAGRDAASRMARTEAGIAAIDTLGLVTVRKLEMNVEFSVGGCGEVSMLRGRR